MHKIAFRLSAAVIVFHFAAACDDDGGTSGRTEAGVDSGRAGGAPGGSNGAGGNAMGAGGVRPGGAGGSGGGHAKDGGPAEASTGGSAGAGHGGSPDSSVDGSAPVDAGPEAGEGGAEGPKSCEVACTTDDNCIAPAICDPTSQRCIDCNVHADCIPVVSGWTGRLCAGDGDCIADLAEVCVQAGLVKTGMCAEQVDPDLGCLDFGDEPITVPKFGIDALQTVDVCGRKSGRCEAHHCFTGCTDDVDFCMTVSPGYGDTCDAASGRCTCQSDDECQFGPLKCNPSTHTCVSCATSADCNSQEPGKDVCVEGQCGCSAASTCPPPAPATGTRVCE